MAPKRNQLVPPAITSTHEETSSSNSLQKPDAIDKQFGSSSVQKPIKNRDDLEDSVWVDDQFDVLTWESHVSSAGEIITTVEDNSSNGYVEKPRKNRPMSILTWDSSTEEEEEETERGGVFLEACYGCKKKLNQNQDIQMFGCLLAFCSHRCRSKHMDIVELKKLKRSLRTVKVEDADIEKEKNQKNSPSSSTVKAADIKKEKNQKNSPSSSTAKAADIEKVKNKEGSKEEIGSEANRPGKMARFKIWDNYFK